MRKCRCPSFVEVCKFVPVSLVSQCCSSFALCSQAYVRFPKPTGHGPNQLWI